MTNLNGVLPRTYAYLARTASTKLDCLTRHSKDIEMRSLVYPAVDTRMPEDVGENISRHINIFSVISIE